MTSNEDEGDDESVVTAASFTHSATRAIPPGSLIVVTLKHFLKKHFILSY